MHEVALRNSILSSEAACFSMPEDRLLGLAGSAYQVAARVLGRTEGAEDVVQEAYLRAWKQLRAGAPPESERAWFLKVVANTAREQLRANAARRRREKSMTSETRSATTPEPEQVETIERLREAMGRLEERYRLPLALCYEQGLNQREAAFVLDVPESTLSDRLQAGLAQIRKALEKGGCMASVPVVISCLSQTAPVVPIGMGVAVKNLASGAALGVQVAPAIKAAASGLMLGKTILALLLAIGGVGLWRWAGPAGPPQILVTPSGADATLAFEEVRLKGGPRVVLLGSKRKLLVPVKLRFMPTEGRKLVEAVAGLHELGVVWLRDGEVAVIQRGAKDAEVEKILAGLKSREISKRLEAACQAGWVEDVRVLRPLAGAAIDPDPEVAWQAARSAERLGLHALAALDDEKTLMVIEKMFEDEDAKVPEDAMPALGFIGNESALALLEKALQNKDRSVRMKADHALRQVDREKTLILLEKKHGDRDPSLISSVRNDLAYGYAHSRIAKDIVQLEKDVADPSARVRISAVNALGKVGGEKALALLESALVDLDATVRKCAASSLGQIGGEKALALLEKTLADPSPSVRSDVAEALFNVSEEKAVALLEKALQDQSFIVRTSAAKALGQIGSAKAVALLAKSLEDLHPNARMFAEDALGEIGGEKVLALCERILANKDAEMRSSAAKILGRIGGEKALALIEDAMEDPDFAVRGSAAYALIRGQMGGEKALALLEKALGDDSSVRAEAVDALGQIGGEKALGLLERELQNTNAGMRARVVSALGQIQGKKAVALLEMVLEDPDAFVRERAINALCEIGSMKALPWLEKALEDPNARVRGQAASSLGKLRGEKTMAALGKALRDKDENVRMSAVAALDYMGDEKTLALLEPALADQSAKVRKSAVAALHPIGNKKARDILLKHLAQEKDGHVLRAIASKFAASDFCDPSSYFFDAEVAKALQDLKLPSPEEATPENQKQPPPTLPGNR